MARQASQKVRAVRDVDGVGSWSGWPSDVDPVAALPAGDDATGGAPVVADRAPLRQRVVGAFAGANFFGAINHFKGGDDGYVDHRRVGAVGRGATRHAEGNLPSRAASPNDANRVGARAGDDGAAAGHRPVVATTAGGVGPVAAGVAFAEGADPEHAGAGQRVDGDWVADFVGAATATIAAGVVVIRGGGEGDYVAARAGVFVRRVGHAL